MAYGKCSEYGDCMEKGGKTQIIIIEIKRKREKINRRKVQWRIKEITSRCRFDSKISSGKNGVDVWLVIQVDQC